MVVHRVSLGLHRVSSGLHRVSAGEVTASFVANILFFKHSFEILIGAIGIVDHI